MWMWATERFLMPMIAPIKPDISLKSRSSCQTLIPAQHLSTKTLDKDTVQGVEDSQETQLLETRCEAMSSNEQSDSTVFPNTQNMEKMKIDKTKEETSMPFQEMGSINTKKTSEGDTEKRQDDFQYASACLHYDCICKKSSVSMGKLADVQHEVQQLLRSVPMSEDSNHQMKHLLRSMQQHLRQLTKKQHVHLQNLRELTKQPTTFQPPDLKSQLKQIMAEKQQMLQLLKKHHTLASTLNVVTKESSAGTDRQQATDGSNSDTGSLKSVSSHISTSMLAAGKSEQHASENHRKGSLDNPIKKIKAIPSLTHISPKPSTASTSIDHTSSPVDIQSKWVSQHSLVDASAKSQQHAVVSDPMAHQSSAGAPEAQVAFTKNTEQTPLVKSIKLSTEDINKIIKTHLSSQQHQTSGKTFQPSKIVINIPKPQTTTSVSLQLKPQTEQNVLRPATNFHAVEKSVENQSSSARLSFPTLANSSANISFPRSVSNSQSSISVPVARPVMEKSTSGPQYHTTNAIASSFVGSQSHPASKPPIRVQTAVKSTAPLTSTSTIPTSRGIAPLETANIIPPVSYQLSQSSNQFQSRFGVPQRQSTQNISSSNLNPYQPGQNVQNSYPATSRSHNNEVESANKCFERQQTTQDRVQVFKKPATLVQLLESKLLQPGQNVLSFTASNNDQTYRASLDAKGFIIDKDRGCFTGPSQWVASVTTRSVASASKIAWKLVHFRGESLVSLQQQWAARQVSSSSTIAHQMPTVSLESQAVPDQSASKHDLGLNMLASDVRVHLIMTEELFPVTKADWEHIPSRVYADIDKWE